MTSRSLACALFALTVAISGCAGGAAGKLAPRARARTSHVSSSESRVTLSTFQAAFSQDDWTAVQHQFLSPRLGEALVSQMRTWKADGVGNLRATLVYRGKTINHRYIGTIEFSDDPRAVSFYAIYIFRGNGTSARIVGTTTGINGRNYRDASWAVTRSAHFVFYHSPYELQGQDRAHIADLEYQRRQFMRKFGVKVAKRIDFYWYPKQYMMAPLTSDACGSSPDLVGCALPDLSTPIIHTSEWPTYHEPIHVYQRAIEPAVGPHQLEYVAPLFIAEGMAVALEDREVDPNLSDYCSDLRYIPLDACAREALPGISPVSLLADKGFERAQAGDAYLLAGSFVKYLVLKYGYRPFGRFYYLLAAQPLDRVRDYNVATKRVFHASITALLGAWQRQLCAGSC